MVIIRDVRLSDYSKLEEIHRPISDDGICELEKAEKIITSITEDENKRMLVAEESETGELLGTLYGLAFEDICGEGKPILLVENVSVKESAQGRGIGRLLFEEIERWGKTRECHYEILVSGNSRSGAHEFYRKLNFEEVKGFKKYDF